MGADAIDQPTVEALGKLSEALETIERARGHLFELHQLIGHADLMLDDAVEKFRKAGHDDVADRLQNELVGHNVIEGRWTFQIVEEFEDGYYALWRSLEQAARDELAGGRRHLFEAQMKEERRTHGRRGHGRGPQKAR